MDVPGIPRPVLVVLIAIAVVLFAGGAAWSLSWVTHHTDTHTRNLAAPSSLEIEATSGDVDVRARNATLVRAVTTSGDVHVSVPDRTYAVQTRATSGDEHVEVHVDPRSPRRLVASTTSGDVHVSADG